MKAKKFKDVYNDTLTVDRCTTCPAHILLSMSVGGEPAISVLLDTDTALRFAEAVIRVTRKAQEKVEGGS